MNLKIKNDLEKIYSMIPDFKCKHCHECCGPIIWFEPEELLIKEYAKQHNIKRVVWSKNEFEQNNMKCPYLREDKCIIYPVRPIVCRLQGNIPSLKCNLVKNNNLIFNKKLEKIKKEFIKLIKNTNGLNIYHSTRKI